LSGLFLVIAGWGRQGGEDLDMPTLQVARHVRDEQAMHHQAGVGLLERGAELARIDQAIASLSRGHGRVLIIQGAAGIGKSSLLRTACEQATAQGVQTLTARASELERDFGFGVVRQLLRLTLLAAASRNALSCWPARRGWPARCWVSAA
jgi:AAA ATPase domain